MPPPVTLSRSEGSLVPGGSLLQVPISGRNALGIMNRLQHYSARVRKIPDRHALFGQEHTIVPDGSGPIDPCHVDHGRIVVVACPDAHLIIRSVTNRPVI